MAVISEEQAGDLYDELITLAGVWVIPGSLTEALNLVESAAIAPLSAEAIQYYVAEGKPVLNLAGTVRDCAVRAFVAAQFPLALGRPGDSELATQRRVFQDVTVSLSASLEAGSAPGLSRRLIGTMRNRLGVGREFLKQAEHDSVSAWMSGRDLLEAAGVGLLLANLVENPGSSSTD